MPSLYMTGKTRQKFEYLEKEKSFNGEVKNITFKGFSVANYCLGPESAPLIFINFI